MQPGDGAFGHVDTELEKLTMNSRGAPEKVCGDHARDQGPNFRQILQGIERLTWHPR